ncbi:MAG: redox-regulated ATPase YchF [SAR324 cluster bacterium]|nr:redox-regulated ATPase YchF [SAR324 cluster bacterium]MBL7035161.1 redox-regulated ATPase YchF [SAR324 cluster bacterium]
MALEVGIVGLPNVGKSTLFSALTKVQAEAANYPFCTIDPNVGIVPVRDSRMQRLTDLVTPDKIVPATLQVVDIAGLVKGASQGEGLGNQFLSHIRQVHALAHVVRCFSDENIVHVDGNLDPISDVEIIQTELILSDLEQVERKVERLQRQLKANRALAADLPVFERMLTNLGEGKLALSLDLNADEKKKLGELNLLTLKPYLYIANVSEEGLQIPDVYEKQLRELAEEEGVEVIPICAQVEAELSEMEEQEYQFFLQELGIDSSGLDRLTHSGYQLLDQITFFTAGKQELRAWEIQQGSTAPQAAGKIHTDFEKGFIRAEVFHYDDIDQLGSESSVKEAGRWRLEGRDYVVQDGDVMHFRFNV